MMYAPNFLFDSSESVVESKDLEMLKAIGNNTPPLRAVVDGVAGAMISSLIDSAYPSLSALLPNLLTME